MLPVVQMHSSILINVDLHNWFLAELPMQLIDGCQGYFLELCRLAYRIVLICEIGYVQLPYAKVLYILEGNE